MIISLFLISTVGIVRASWIPAEVDDPTEDPVITTPHSIQANENPIIIKQHSIQAKGMIESKYKTFSLI